MRKLSAVAVSALILTGGWVCAREAGVPAGLRVAGMFTDHMVLQRDMPALPFRTDDWPLSTANALYNAGKEP